jgi:hypothetical protein
LITFVTRALASRWADIGRLGLPDEFPERVRTGVDVWIICTYLELRARASSLPFQVRIAGEFPPGGAVVAHRDDLRLQLRYWNSYVAAVRADRPYIHLTPWQIVQNPVQADGHAVHIPSWPQPGLVPRDPARRGVKVLGYFGRSASIPGFFRDPAFLAELARRGIGFHADDKNWRDYSGCDVCIALRYSPEIGLATKPYAKLVNAWQAGVPALVGPEPAYRHLRTSELDYIEVSCARDVLAALDRLQADPALHAAMVEHGRRRGEEFSRDAVARRWIDFLAGQFLPAWKQWRPGGFPEAAVRLARQWRETRRYKALEAQQELALRESKAGERMEDAR